MGYSLVTPRLTLYARRHAMGAACYGARPDSRMGGDAPTQHGHRGAWKRGPRVDSRAISPCVAFRIRPQATRLWGRRTAQLVDLPGGPAAVQTVEAPAWPAVPRGGAIPH